MFENVKIESCMSSCPHTVGAEQTLAMAGKLMEEHQIRHLPVKEGGELLGVISNRDIYFARAVDLKSPESLTVKELLVDQTYIVNPDQDLVEVAKEMAERKIGCALVVNQGSLQGIFTTTDACKLIGKVQH